jgi:hypothetical protein
MIEVKLRAERSKLTSPNIISQGNTIPLIPEMTTHARIGSSQKSLCRHDRQSGRFQPSHTRI